jgi:hypothetical protein
MSMRASTNLLEIARYLPEVGVPMGAQHLVADTGILEHGLCLLPVVAPATVGHEEPPGRAVQRRLERDKRQQTRIVGVCPNEAAALFWDVVHPTSFTHCWQAWVFERALSAAGWIEKPEPVQERRAWCRAVSERTLGMVSTEWILAPAQRSPPQ